MNIFTTKNHDQNLFGYKVTPKKTVSLLCLPDTLSFTENISETSLVCPYKIS